MRGYLPMLLVLSAIWGASYYLIKVAVAEMEPTSMMALRLVLAGAVLVAVLLVRTGARRALEEVQATGRGAVILGAFNTAIPFTLIAWGEKHIDSGIAAIANATVPIFVAMIAIKVKPSERVTGVRLGGVVLGLVGVAVLAGLKPEGGWWGVAGTLAVVVASLSYASAQLYAQLRFPETSPLVVATAAVLAGAAILLPFGILQWPERLPSWEVLGAVAALGIGGTAIASLFLYEMITRYGSSRTALVTYLLPPFALFYGAVLLSEPLTLNALLGLGLILGGVALGSGMLRLPRRATAPVIPAP